MKSLVPYVQIGCTFAILKRMKQRKELLNNENPYLGTITIGSSS